ncbi:MAG: HIT family protein [Gammaproteobacteria bacterium]|nr:HIT family protein [Gammaproteobacteria bacterium]MCW9030754.1 HIT family protein [Gammaproteobacteria bacterium]
MKFDPRLLNDCVVIGKFTLCHVLLMRDANYPWCVLVPDREDMIEIFDLSDEDQTQLNLESNTLLEYLKNEFHADKMNVAALGNVVSQLHIHHIVRYKTDIAWPAPVWGAHPAKKYSDEELASRISRLVKGFANLNLGFQASDR